MGDVDPAGATVSPAEDPAGPAREAPPLVPGTQVDKYRLVRVIGSGGMGVVWAAHDPDLDREVALKVLRSVDAGQTLRTRLLREARAMARLKHPNVLTVYEVGTEYDRDYIVMELVEGGNLDTWLATKPPPAQVWAAMLAAGRGLAAAHDAGLVHRDFKPHNVLRSDDGRVMVTDFGLARGIAEAAEAVDPTTVKELKEPDHALEETLVASDSGDAGTTSNSPTGKTKADPLLDSPLTQTGAMIGTPAYMAPEQFTGGFHGPRTDQFAFCVTVWQALTGTRPFRGETVAELARAVLRGADEVQAELPGAVRAVLVRGLEPDPTKRWPDLAQLLAALERAGGQSRRRWTFAFAAVAIVAVIALSVFALRKDKPAVAAGPPPACPDPASAIDGAWSPQLHASYVTRLGTPAFRRAADQLDEFRGAWMGAYRSACAAPGAVSFHARVACLQGERDELAAQVGLIDQLPATAFEGFDAREFLPRLADCTGEHPMAPPELPADPGKKQAIQKARTTAILARLVPPLQGLEMIEALEATMKQLDWKPLEAEVYEAAGVIAQHAGHDDVARRALARAAKVAALARYFRVESRARTELVESAIVRAANPRDPEELRELFEEARDAIASSGNDPSLTAEIDGLEAEALAAQARPDKAIAPGERALAVQIQLGDARRAAHTAARLATSYAARDAEGDLALARSAVTRAEQVAVAAGAPVDPDLDEIGAEVAWRQRDLADVHRRLARARPRKVETKLTWVGRVVDDKGAPVAGARVVGWSGELAADAQRLFVAPAGTVEATTDATGEFSLVADELQAIAAELGDRRSLPLRVPPVPGKPLVVPLGPTHTIVGHVASGDKPLTGVTAEVILAVGDASLIVQAPVQGDGAFTVANVPVGPVRVVATGAAGDGSRRTAHAEPVHGDEAYEVRWPVVQPLDVIVRGASNVDIYVVAGKVAPRNRAELLAAVDRAQTFALADLTGIGADTTAAGRQLYTPDDHHAIVEGVAVVSTACALAREPDSLPECKTITPHIEKDTIRGGHHSASAIAVVLEVGELIGAPTVIRDER